MKNLNVFAVMPYNCTVGPYYYKTAVDYCVGQTVIINLKNKFNYAKSRLIQEK